MSETPDRPALGAPSDPSESATNVGLPTPPPYPCPGWSSDGEGDYEWVRADEDWKAGGLDRRCRMRGCLRPAVLRLNRWQHRRGRGRCPMWWHYCAEHSFSRVVHDGAVWEPRRIWEDEA